MGKKVQGHTVVRHPKTQEFVWFYPGDDVPDWAEDLITNPKVFEAEGAAEEVESMIEETTKTIDYGKMNIAQLDAQLDERGLSTRGKKAEKVERLKQSDGATG